MHWNSSNLKTTIFGGWISNVMDMVRNLQDAVRLWIGYDRMTYLTCPVD